MVEFVWLSLSKAPILTELLMGEKRVDVRGIYKKILKCDIAYIGCQTIFRTLEYDLQKERKSSQEGNPKIPG